jgi:hypothetical protein
MTNAATDEVFIFVHLPKTGGQTLRGFFEKALVFHREAIHLGPYGIKQAETLGLLPFEQRSPEERRQARVILGHNVTVDTAALVPGKIPRLISFLRDPAEMLMSHYNFHMEFNFRQQNKPAIPFDEWYTEKFRGNVMTGWLYREFLRGDRCRAVTAEVLREVQQALESFWFVGCTEFMDRDLPTLLNRMGIAGTPERANVSGVHHKKLMELDDSLRQRLYRDNPFDRELYQHWYDRLDQNLRRIGNETSRPGAKPLVERLHP